MLGIILSLINAKQGIILIDEIENGIHYSIHSKLWELIFTLSEELQVQIFATTHSWDCIEEFQHSVRGEEGMLIRLEERQGEIVPILFDAKRLSIATRQDIEVR